jgi:hypothetical protein
VITFAAGTRLDVNDRARARLTVPALPFAAPMTAHHAFVVIGSTGLEFVSHAAPVRITGSEFTGESRRDHEPLMRALERGCAHAAPSSSSARSAARFPEASVTGVGVKWSL